MWVDSIYPKHWNPQDLELSMGGKAEAAASRSTEPLLAMPGSSPRLCSEHTRPTYPLLLAFNKNAWVLGYCWFVTGMGTSHGFTRVLMGIAGGWGTGAGSVIDNSLVTQDQEA